MYLSILLSGPLSRFGDTACNALVQGALDALDPFGSIPVFLRMGVASGGTYVCMYGHKYVCTCE